LRPGNGCPCSGTAVVTSGVRNDGDVPARFLKIALGFFDEQDIERVDEEYLRIDS
jgi:hypothetical protein